MSLVESTDVEGTHAVQYFYDNFKRIATTHDSESSSQFFFEKQFQYDLLGRLSKEYNNAVNLSDNKSSSNWTRKTFKNGYNWQIFDDTTGKILWQANSVNEKGQLTAISMGNGTIENVISISNIYDQYGFPFQIKYDKTTIPSNNIATLNMYFNPQKSNVETRSNSMFNWNETFQYDNLDRLKEYTNAKGLQETQSYDDKGRIYSNDLGQYNYTKPSNNYQNTSVTLSSEAKAYYNLKEGVFFDTMETKNGWINTNTTVFSFDTTFSNSDNGGGTTSLKINNTTTTEKIIQSEIWVPINNNIATQYTYSGWVYSNSPQSEIFLYMKNTSGTISTNQVQENTINQWKFITKTVLVPADIKQLCVRLDNNGSGIVWFDNIKIRRTDVPIITTDSEKYLDITYNTFKSPIAIVEPGNDRLNFSYNPGNSRSIMYYGGMQLDKYLRPLRKYYSEDGSMEIKRNLQTGQVEFLTYICGDGYTAPMVLKSDGITKEYLYLVRDYQSSIIAIANQDGNIIEKRLFDAWGNILKVQDSDSNSLSKMMVLDRGYTGHEHLQGINIIHMNGKLYDSKLHRFLQPDNNLQDLLNSQNYNRYSYVLNNPLKYIDPSGESGEFPNDIVNETYCDGCGISNTEQSTIGNSIATLESNWDEWKIKDWANRNIGLNQFNNAAKSAGNFVEKNVNSFLDDVGDFFGGLFGGGKSNSTPAVIPQMQLNGPSPNLVSSGTNNYYSGSNSNADIHLPTQHIFASVNMTALSEGNFLQQTLYGMANTVNIVGQYTIGRGVGDSSMRNLNGTATSTSEGVLSIGTIPLNFVGLNAIGNGINAFLNGGKAFLNSGLRNFSSLSTQFVLKNSRILNNNNWVRLGKGQLGSNHYMRLSIGAGKDAYNAMSPGIMKNFNAWLRTFGQEGHFYYKNWF